MKARSLLVHGILIAFLLLTLVPWLTLVSISLRPGNTQLGPLLPEKISGEHWARVLEIPYAKSYQVKRELNLNHPFQMNIGQFGGIQNQQWYFEVEQDVPADLLPFELALSWEHKGQRQTLWIDITSNQQMLQGEWLEEVPPRPIMVTVHELEIQLPELPVIQWLKNSIVVALIASLLIVALATLAAFSLVYIRHRHNGRILFSLLVLQQFPNALFLAAIYGAVKFLGKWFPFLGVDQHPTLILTYLGSVPLYIWLLASYLKTLDGNLIDAARTDGANHWQSLFYVIFPLSVPMLAVLFLISFMGLMAEYPLASVLLESPEQQTLAVGAQQFTNDYKIRWGEFSATALMVATPMTLVFLGVQKALGKRLEVTNRLD